MFYKRIRLLNTKLTVKSWKLLLKLVRKEDSQIKNICIKLLMKGFNIFFLKRIINSAKNKFLWKNNCGKRNQYKSENLKYRTRSGIFVRSKSERMIADVLNDLGVVFRYEAGSFLQRVNIIILTLRYCAVMELHFMGTFWTYEW